MNPNILVTSCSRTRTAPEKGQRNKIREWLRLNNKRKKTKNDYY